MKPVFLCRAFAIASGLPQGVSQSRDVIVIESVNAMPCDSRQAVPMSFPGVFQRQTRELMPGQVVLLALVLLGRTVGMGRRIVHFGGLLVVLVMRTVVIAFGHFLESPHLTRLIVGFLREFVGMIRILKRPLGVPTPRNTVPFFVMFGRGAVRAGSKLVLFGCQSVVFVHCLSSVEFFLAVP
jgi:hypothetical protein